VSDNDSQIQADNVDSNDGQEAANVAQSLSIDEAAQLYDVSPRTIRRRIKDGELSAYQRPTTRGFEWRVVPGGIPETIDSNDRQDGVNDSQATANVGQPTIDTQPNPIFKALETIERLQDDHHEEIEQLRQDHRAEVDRLERDKEALRQAAEHWQARYLEGQERLIRLLPAPADEPEPSEVAERRSWWRRLFG
jgi:excisionase family DNA binding protein